MMSLLRLLDYKQWTICFCLLVELCSRSTCQVNYLDEAGKIFGTIFHKYNAGVPPWSNHPTPIPISLYVKPVHILGVDPTTKLMTSTVDIRIQWNDKSLAWFIQVVDQLTVHEDRVWHPHISIDNAVGKTLEIDNPDLILSRSGIVTMQKRLEVTTVCDSIGGLTEFNCTIDVVSILHSSRVVAFNASSVFDTNRTTLVQGLELVDSSTSIGNVTKWNDGKNITHPVFSCRVALVGTGSYKARQGGNDCSNGSNGSYGVIYPGPLKLANVWAVLTVLFLKL